MIGIGSGVLTDSEVGLLVETTEVAEVSVEELEVDVIAELVEVVSVQKMWEMAGNFIVLFNDLTNR